MKKWLVAAAVTAALGATAVQAKDWKDVRIAVDVPYEPFEYKAPDGTLTGFEVDLGNAVCENAKLNCSWVVQAWDGIIPGSSGAQIRRHFFFHVHHPRAC